jgi:N-acetyl-gamma-glutamyl-phosphate reductase
MDRGESMKTRVGVIGATGYTGVELLRLLARHPGVEVTVLTSQKYAGQPIDRVFPSLAAHAFPACEEMSIDTVAGKVDFVFTAVPHKTAMETVPLFLARGKRVVDLSADFRFSDVTVYERWYQKHTAPELLSETVFGLPELHRERIRSARIVGNPGCYPTSAILGLAPLIGGGFVSLSNIISDSKSGVTGAGRDAVVDSLFCEVNEGVKAYKIFQHRHLAEIEGELSWVAGKKVTVTFVPHLIPMSRGILSTLYVNLNQPMKLEDVLQVYTDRYRGEPFVRVLPKGKVPCTRDVKGANFCDIGVQVNEEDGRVVVVSVIDNLTKGASGQAVQNMNIMLGFPETMGLDVVPLFP